MKWFVSLLFMLTTLGGYANDSIIVVKSGKPGTNLLLVRGKESGVHILLPGSTGCNGLGTSKYAGGEKEMKEVEEMEKTAKLFLQLRTQFKSCPKRTYPMDDSTLSLFSRLNISIDGQWRYGFVPEIYSDNLLTMDGISYLVYVRQYTGSWHVAYARLNDSEPPSWLLPLHRLVSRLSQASAAERQARR